MAAGLDESSAEYPALAGDRVQAAPLIVIVGPTASGKTAVALRLAADFNGEIIAADSRTVYKGLDIGTAKPTLQEQAQVPHHLIDVAGPGETYTAARFQADARAAIATVRDRGRVPFIVGGSGLYVDGLLFGYAFGPAADTGRRATLETMSVEELVSYCRTHNIAIPHNERNKRYVIRAIEQGGINKQRSDIPSNTIIVGITTNKETLKERIAVRARSMFNEGLAKEAQWAGAAYGWDSDPLRAPAYTAAKDLSEGKITTDDALDRLIHADMRLAKKQRTWFKRNEHITWLMADDVYPFIAQALTGQRDHVKLKV